MSVSFTELLPATKSEKHGALTWEPAADSRASALAGVLTLTGKRNHCRYRVSEYAPDMPGRAFVLVKLDAGTDTTEERYSCLVAGNGGSLCVCRGFTATRGCKHIAGLAELIRAGVV